MSLNRILHRGLQRDAAATALVEGARRVSYADLFERVARTGAGLVRLGIAPGDRVAMIGRTGIDAVVLMFACWWVRAVFCPLNTRWSAAEVGDALLDGEPALLVFDSPNAQAAAAQRERVGATVRSVDLGELAGEGAEGGEGGEHAEGNALLVDQRPDDGDLAALIYTGGTTGRSKGVILTHGNLVASAACRLADNDSLVRSVALITTPIFHIASITRLLPHLMAGGICLLSLQFDAGEALSLIEREGVTDLPVVPTMLQMLLEHPAFRPERLRSVRRLSYGAAPSAGALLQRAVRTLPWAGLHQYYGMTESSAVATMSYPGDHEPPAWASGRARSAGRPCTLVEVRVADERGHDVAPGEVGEVLLRGPVVSPGYWRQPTETARTFRDGWLRTGDAGKLDADGYLYVVDRVKDMIVTGGENVYSAEVENALAQHADVAAVAVIGIPHERWGEAVHAVVVLRPGAAATAEGLQAHCRELIAGYKVPKGIDFLAQLPLTAAGKTAKTQLRAPFWAGRDRRVN